MGVPTSEVGYNSATTGRGDHEVHKGHVVALEKKCLWDLEELCETIVYFLQKRHKYREINTTRRQK
jgi:hypothetical protein